MRGLLDLGNLIWEDLPGVIDPIISGKRAVIISFQFSISCLLSS